MVKYIGELLTKWVSSLFSDNWVLKSVTLNLQAFIVGLNYNRDLLVLVLDNLGYFRYIVVDSK